MFNGGRRGKINSTTKLSTVTGIWNVNEVHLARTNDTWPVVITPGQQAYTTPGTYTWIAPATVTLVSAVCIGGGAGYRSPNGGGGGGLGWKNNISVVPGQSYTVVVGAAGAKNQSGGDSYFIDTTTVRGIGGNLSGAGGSYVGDGGGTGGAGGSIGISDSLATGVTYTVSSTYSSNSPPTYQYMNDSNANGSTNGNQWGSNATGDQFIKADLGSTKVVTKIIIGYDYLTNLPGGWGVTYTEGLSIQVSSDNSTWTTVGTTPTYSSTGSTNGLVSISIGAMARYVRLFKTGYIAALEFQVWTGNAPGGGGAGGYSGNGGAGGAGTSASSGQSGSAGSGGAGGGGGGFYAGGGGGVGILGEGASGTGGDGSTDNANNGGSGGSGGSQGARNTSNATGGAYGGGGGFNSGTAAGAAGAVRLIWGSGRVFPSTNTTDV